MRIAALTMLATLTFTAVACGDDDADTTSLRADLVAELGLTEDQASCVVDELGSRASVLIDILADADFEPSEDDIVALDRAGDECGLE